MKFGLTFVAVFIFLEPTLGQQKDSLKSDPSKAKELASKAIGSIRRNSEEVQIFTVKSEDAFLPYEGKIIRKIYYEQIGFDRTVQDTLKTIKNFLTRAANRLHNDSKPWVIRNNVFVKEGKPLNPYRVADNERYLRDLDFILDSRIFVLHESEDSDSVDLLIMTRDVFSLGASFNPRSPTEYRFKLQDANLAGMGQRLQISTVFDTERQPKLGQEILYRKVNLFGSFIDGTIGYTTIDNAASVGNENETAWYLRLNRPLFNPFTRWAGGMEWSRNYSSNVFMKDAALFAKYDYKIQDLWAGYSFGHAKLPNSIRENRNRKFIAFRGYQKEFTTYPDVPLTSNERLLYEDRVSFLSQLTLFRQDFYKTKYVLGFGRTEDVPYGYRISFTGGWEKERGSKRPYLSADLYWNHVNSNGTFYTYGVKVASYFNNSTHEDALLQLNFTRFSKVYPMGKFNVRHQGDLGYAQQFNQKIKRELDIRDGNGLFGFKPDSLNGTRRLTLRTEAIVFTPWKILGFHLAPVTRIDLAYLAQSGETVFQKHNFFSGYSVALRARNENLIFNTIEARVYYYPNTVEGISNTRVEFRANLRIKYPTSLISAPGTVYDP